MSCSTASGGANLEAAAFTDGAVTVYGARRVAARPTSQKQRPRREFTELLGQGLATSETRCYVRSVLWPTARPATATPALAPTVRTTHRVQE
jgi:hypothetical protein